MIIQQTVKIFIWSGSPCNAMRFSYLEVRSRRLNQPILESNENCALVTMCLVSTTSPWARFSKAPESFRARKAMLS